MVKKEDLKWVLPIAMTLIGLALLWYYNAATSKCALVTAVGAVTQEGLALFVAKGACTLLDWQLLAMFVVGAFLVLKGIRDLTGL